MLKSYATGFVLAVVLTVVPFGLVATHALAPSAALIAIAVFAVVQVLVHLRYFLHLDLASPRENLLALGFTALLVLIMIGGSLWIMLDLHQRMMPG